jgi:hypothetical protein
MIPEMPSNRSSSPPSTPPSRPATSQPTSTKVPQESRAVHERIQAEKDAVFAKNLQID